MYHRQKCQEKGKCSRAKKGIIVATLVLLGLCALLLILSLLIDLYEKNANRKEEEATVDYDFSAPDFDADIYQNEKYAEYLKGGILFFNDPATGVGVGYDRENSKVLGDDVAFLTEWIYDIIEGNCEGYNDSFSEEYYRRHNEKEPYTMQMLYDVELTRISVDEMTDKSGGSYTSYSFTVTYRILENNGTFRRDIGDGAKKQYVTLTDREGVLLIDSITTAKTVK